MTDNIYINDTERLIDFISKSPSCFHVIENMRCTLASAGYTELYEGSEWIIERGGKYFVTRNQSSIIAFSVPEKDFNGFMICASHSDSPTFKLKPNSELECEGAYVKLNTEKYGGMIYSSWLDRPLSVAGRVVVDTGSAITSRLVCIDRDLCVIPNLAIHMDRDINSGYKYNVQKDMLPVIGDITSKNKLMSEIADNININENDILGYDLFLYNREQGKVWGINNEFFSSPKIDDLQCAYSSMRAILESKNEHMIPVMAVFDNEEVGSGTKQGAKSTFMTDTLERICLCFGKTREQLMQYAASSMMLSADNSHAVHPNHSDKACPTNRPKMNCGVVIKRNASQSYTTDGIAEAMLKKLFKDADVPFQDYANRSDIAGGSTLGNLSNEKFSLNTADIGMAQLAMHSCYETGGTKDTTYLINAMKIFYSSTIRSVGNRCYELN